MEKYLYICLLSVGTVLVLFGLIAIVKVASTSGKVDYCYIASTNAEGLAYRVVGHRPWRPDTTIGLTGTAEQADTLMYNSVVCFSK